MATDSSNRVTRRSEREPNQRDQRNSPPQLASSLDWLQTFAAITGVAVAAVSALVLAACGGPDIVVPTATPPVTGVTSPAPTADPPLRFGNDPIPVGNGPVAIADRVVYSYSDDGLVATDLTTGSARWTTRLPDATMLLTSATAQNDPLVPAVLTDNNGRKVIMTAYYVAVEGSGTQQDTDETVVALVDTDGRIRWHRAIQPGSLAPRVAGELHDSRGAAAVIDNGRTIATLDMDSGTPRWTRTEMIATGVDGNLVIGLRAGEDRTDPWTLTALRGTDGTKAWDGPQGRTGLLIGYPPEVVLAGRGRAALAGLQGEYDPATVLIDTATGKPIMHFPGDYHCKFDQRDTLVCYEPGPGYEPPEEVAAFDVHNGHRLWKLPDSTAGRTTLTVMAAFHGVIYGTAQTGVILDARTGRDLVTDTDITPTDLVPGYGLVVSAPGDNNPTLAYPATN